MKIPNKKEIQKIAYSHSSGMEFKDFMNLYKKILQNHILFLVIDATLASDNPLCFRKNPLEKI